MILRHSTSLIISIFLLTGCSVAEEPMQPEMVEEVSQESSPAVVEVDLDHLDIDQTYLQAWESVRKAAENNPKIDAQIQLYTAPAVTEERLLIERKVIDRTAQLWGNDFEPENARILYVMKKTPGDRDWLVQTVEELGGLRYMIGDVRKWYDEDCGALASSGDNKLTMIFCLDPKPKTHDLHIVAHEYTHWYQATQGNIPNNGPNWLVEGGATFYGMTMGYIDQEDADATRLKSFTWNLYGEDDSKRLAHGTSMEKALSQTEDEFVEMMVELEEMSMMGGAQLRYLYGSLASEALIASYGHEKMQLFYQSFKDSKNWQESFSDIYGLSVKDFYTKLYPYAKAVLTKANGE